MQNAKKSNWKWIALLVLVIAVVTIGILDELSSDREGSLEDLRIQLENGNVTEVRIDDGVLDYRLRDRTWFTTFGSLDQELAWQLNQAGVKIAAKKSAGIGSFILYAALPALILVLVVVYFLSRMGKSQFSEAKKLTDSRSKSLGEPSAIRLSDVGGCADAKEMLQDVIGYLKDPERWGRLGAQLPRGVLLEGPPGSGKTLLARAVAGESSAHFEHVSATEFVELFVGVGAARLRDMFDRVAQSVPAIIFIDELDAIGRRRGVSFGFNNEERENTLNQLLVLLDGFEKLPQIVVIAATNRSDILDPALLRAGRFDRRIKLGEPDRNERREILALHTAGKSIANEVSLDHWADDTTGMTGAQLASLINEAALIAARTEPNDNDQGITNRDLEQALIQSRKTQFRFSKLDLLLTESLSNLVEPVSELTVRITQVDQTDLEGQIVWADPTYLKIQSRQNGHDVLITRKQVLRIETI